MRRTAVTVAGLAMVGMGSAACSTSTSAPSTPPSTEASLSALPSSSPMGSVLPPIEITEARKTVDVKVGDTLNVTTADVTQVSTDNAEVLKVSQPRDDGSAQFNAGAEVASAGTAKLMVYGAGDKQLYVVTVTAAE